MTTPVSTPAPTQAQTHTQTSSGRRRPSTGRRRAIVAGLMVAVALGFLLIQGLGNATLYFKTADEAVAERAQLGDRRFRVEGVVVDGTVAQTGEDVRFTIEENGVRVPVAHEGDPPELFQPNIPVVLEGAWSGDRFASDRIMVKHSSEYRAENPERLQP